jgi:TetR/AcrR family transcriptional regulator, cholesterol catabolism regulator
MALKIARKRLDPAIRSELILDEALRLFAERHFSVVTVRDIADACAINVGLIYYYFENKEQLVHRVLAHAIEQFQARYNADQDLNPAQQLVAYLTWHIPIASMLTRMVKLMADYSASAVRDPTTDNLIRNFYKKEQTDLEDLLTRGINERVFPPLNVAAVARSISLQLDGIFYASPSRGDNRIPEDIADLCHILETLQIKK